MISHQSAIPVHHNAAARRYEAEIDGHLAVADYVIDGDRMLFTHTYVPESLRQRGIAEALVRAGLTEARRAGLRVEPRCSYVARFIENHAEYSDLVA